MRKIFTILNAQKCSAISQTILSMKINDAEFSILRWATIEHVKRVFILFYFLFYIWNIDLHKTILLEVYIYIYIYIYTQIILYKSMSQ